MENVPKDSLKVESVQEAYAGRIKGTVASSWYPAPDTTISVRCSTSPIPFKVIFSDKKCKNNCKAPNKKRRRRHRRRRLPSVQYSHFARLRSSPTGSSSRPPTPVRGVLVASNSLPPAVPASNRRRKNKECG